MAASELSNAIRARTVHLAVYSEAGVSVSGSNRGSDAYQTILSHGRWTDSTRIAELTREQRLVSYSWLSHRDVVDPNLHIVSKNGYLPRRETRVRGG